jgi:hypothetical protein
MKARPENIERLLNGYIDGELTVRQQTEVKRLLKNDPRIAKRLKQLQKCKMLVSSVPPEPAPPEMMNDIMSRLARRSLLGEEPAAAGRKAGVRELFVRKVLAAAAMIALFAVFGMVIYSIVAPPDLSDRPDNEIVKSVPPVVPKTVLAKFNGRLELKTAEFMEMDASINRALEENDEVEVAVERLGDKSIYVLKCARKGLNELLDRMDNNWERLDSATLFVESDLFAHQVSVNAVTPPQISEIAAQATLENTIRVAKDFAMFNNLSQTLKSKAVLPQESYFADLGLDRPRIASFKATDKTIIDNPNVELVIVLTRSN